MDVTALVEPDRVHKTVYTDQQIFDREMERIWERIWVYCGHESQVPNAGDYYAVTIGRQPMVMIRQPDMSVQVLYNRCPHRGVQVVGNLKGNTGSAFVCSYHAWSFHLDGSVRAIPLAKGYEGTRMTKDNPDCGMKRAARVDSYRGFVFASLVDEGPTLDEFLGEAKIAFDDMCDRSPLGEVEVVPICHRVMQHSNWKFFMENQLDALHPSVTHQSTGISAGRVEKRLKAEKGAAPLYYHYLSTFASSFEQWDSVQTINFPHGHGILKAYMGLSPRDPDTLEYEALLKNAYGEAKTEEYLSRSIHHVLVYPYLSVQSPLQQLRCLRPVGPDKTMSEIWHFRLKGAPEAIYRRSLWYYNLVNSPATMINADDLENWTKGQWGLQSNGGDWVSFHRYFGDDREENGVTYSNHGTSEAVMRNQFKAWSAYMQGAEGERDGERERQRRNPRHPDRRARLRAPARAGGRDRGRRRGADRRATRRARPFAARADGHRRQRRRRAAQARPGRRRRRAARGRAVPLPPGRAARRQALAGVHRPVRRRRRLLDAGDARADRVGRVAVDLRRRQADDGDQERPGLASERLVAGADVGDEPPRQPRRDRVGDGDDARGPLALPPDGAEARPGAPLRRQLSATLVRDAAGG